MVTIRYFYHREQERNRKIYENYRHVHNPL